MSFLVSPVEWGQAPQVSPQGLPTGYPDCTKGAWPASDDVHVEGLLHSQGQERHAEWLMWARIGVWIAISLAILKQNWSLGGALTL